MLGALPPLRGGKQEWWNKMGLDGKVCMLGFQEILSKGHKTQNDPVKAVRSLIPKLVTIGPMEKTPRFLAGGI